MRNNEKVGGIFPKILYLGEWVKGIKARIIIERERERERGGGERVPQSSIWL